jgi:purine-nucleoside phosphorylase
MEHAATAHGGVRNEAVGPRIGARAAAAVVAARCVARPGAASGAESGTSFLSASAPLRLGVVLGTGLGSLAERLESARSLPADETGWLSPSTATGHAGRVVCGTLPGAGVAGGARGSDADAATVGAGVGVGVVMMQGRVHGYEGHAPERLVRGVELLAALGVDTILLTNASGGLRPDMRTGELVVVADHLDLVRRGGCVVGAGAGDDGGVRRAAGDRPSPAGSVYDPGLVRAALDAAQRSGARARAGVYAHVLGPSYETRAEYRMLRRFAADCVGMSTVPEAIAARRLGLAVAAVSVVTNVARPDAPGRTDAEEVCRAAAAAAEGVWAIIRAIAAATAPAAAMGRPAAIVGGRFPSRP